MADITTVAPGVTRKESWSSYTLTGSGSSLIAAGLAKAEWIPDGLQKDRRGRIRRTVKFDNGECVQRGRDRFDVRIFFPPEEAERRRQLALQRRQYEEALAEEQKELGSMPASHEAYRQQSLCYFEAFIDDKQGRLFGPSKWHGYSYGPEVLEAIDEKMSEIRGILETGRTLYSAERQQARINDVRAKVASADPGLRAFLDRVVKAPQ